MKIKNIYGNLTPTPEQEENILNKIDRKLGEQKPKNNINVTKTVKRKIIPLVACFALVVTAVFAIPHTSFKKADKAENKQGASVQYAAEETTNAAVGFERDMETALSPTEDIPTSVDSADDYTSADLEYGAGVDEEASLDSGAEAGKAFATPSDITIAGGFSDTMYDGAYTNGNTQIEPDARAGMLNGGKIDDVSDMEHFREYLAEYQSYWDFSSDLLNPPVLDSTPKKALDLMFTIDTTYSMADELSYLQYELSDVIERVKDTNAQIPVNLSVNFYRDEGDAYIVNANPFTDDISRALNILKSESCDGGGDFEEAVETALADAIENHEWSSDDTTAKLLFLVLDAPPHSTVAIKDQIQNLLLIAQEKGIVILPVAASGIDKDTERLLRQMAVTTGGTYQFLTNNSYGIGDHHLTPDDKEFEILPLNDLLVDIINSYL